MATAAEEYEVLGPESTAIEAITAGEVNVQVATARRFPRQISGFLKRAEEMCCLNPEIAESCMYALPRGNKTIEGPSARFAEIIASAWTNLRAEGRPVDEGDRFVTVRGTAWDMETNVAIAFEVKRRITNTDGKRYNDDMIGVTQNAAGSIAIRNSILKVIPKAFWGPVYDKARKAAVGDAKTLATKRVAMLEYFMKLGATNDKVFVLLGVKGLEDITLDHLATLKGLATAIKEGDTTVDQAFAPERAAGAAESTKTEPQRKSEQPATPPAQQQSQGAAETAKEPAKPATASRKSQDTKTPPPTAKALFTITAPTVTTGDVFITKTSASEFTGQPYYEVKGETRDKKGKRDNAFVFMTESEDLYKAAASCEGADTPFSVTWAGGKRWDDSSCKVLQALEAKH